MLRDDEHEATGGVCCDEGKDGDSTTSSLAFDGAWGCYHLLLVSRVRWGSPPPALARVAFDEEDVLAASSSLSRSMTMRLC